ncbi:hypothetical protein A9Q96_07680 [Rhodobacterales bacterium 52_120_T64]|nr:hypothetical protein A9Q96_07680 [Rhodobacterales bacterium 52_120_T64]
MDRTDLTLIIGSALVAAVIIGWTLRWFFDRMNTAGPMASDEVVARMREAEAAQTVAETRLVEVETAARNSESQLKAELEAAMTGLGNARRESEQWRVEAEAWRTEVDELRGH